MPHPLRPSSLPTESTHPWRFDRVSRYLSPWSSPRSLCRTEPRQDSASDPPDFSRDVRPILSDHCFACHGPDDNERQADLRLDTSDGLGQRGRSGKRRSQRIDRADRVGRSRYGDAAAEFQKPLSDEQKEVLRQWVDAGAEFQQHWAFVPPERLASWSRRSRGNRRSITSSIAASDEGASSQRTCRSSDAAATSLFGPNRAAAKS